MENAQLPSRSPHSYKATVVYPQHLLMHKSTPKTSRKHIYTVYIIYIHTQTVYTYTFDYVRDNMIILLYTILYIISHKFSTVTDSSVFSVK